MKRSSRTAQRALICCVGLALGCRRDTRPHVDPITAPLTTPGGALPPAPPSPPPRARADAAAPEQRAASRPFVPDMEPAATRADPPGVEPADLTDAAGGVAGSFVIDALVDVAAAGPITATEAGVAMVNRRNELWLARLQRALGSGSAPRETPLAALPDSAAPFPLGRGPAIRRGWAYWVSKGRLLRQRLSAPAGAAPDVLAEDARVGTRATVPLGPARYVEPLPEMAAYVVKQKTPESPLTANLWIAGRSAPLPLTDDTSSAHSVALAATAQGLAALFLEARTGMSTIHLRLIQFTKGAEPTLGEDRVVWVGGPSRSSTEFFALGGDDKFATAFMTFEQDATHFGLAEFQLGVDPGQPEAEPEWFLYPNGIEPAPVASASVCGRPIVALARPTSATPHAPQELVLFDRADRQHPVVVARSKAFFDISLASIGRGALIAYVADHRTWARTIRCSQARPQ